MLEVINCLELPNSQHMIKHCIFYIIGVLSPLMVIQTASEVDHHTKLPLLKQRAAKIGSMAACGKSQGHGKAYSNTQYWISKSQTILKVTLLTFIKILTYCQCPEIIILIFVPLLAKMNPKE